MKHDDSVSHCNTANQGTCHMKIIFFTACALAAFILSSHADAASSEVNKGDTVWIMISTALVAFMTLPGLALFYGGLVRAKNMLSILVQVFTIFCLMIVLWFMYGYSLAFTEGNAIIGGLSKSFLQNVTIDSVTATFTKNVAIPEYAYIIFQATFAAITPALIIGAFAERTRFSAILLFSVLWFTFSYLPIAHMVWYWAGPDAYTDATAGQAATATAGFLFQKGALDFAGGTVVHINAAIAGLVGAFMIGKRTGYGREVMAPHHLPLTMVGAAILWIGWFGFNAGSALEASGTAVLAMLNTLLATSTAALAWMFAEWKIKGQPSLLGIASGAVAGLVAITPACGWVGPGGALAIGLIAGLLCLWGVTGLKRKLNVDDSLDVFGIHGIGGIAGALLTGIFANPALGGTGIYDYVTNTVAPFDTSAQLISQAWGVGLAIIWSGTVSFIAFKVVDTLIGLRVPAEQEREGLDLTSHGEKAYHH